MVNYILKDGEVVEEADVIKWGKWFETAKERRIGSDEFGDVRVSTVFLGIDHNFGGEGPPIVFETMIFGGEHDQYQERYCTLEEAKAGHLKAVELIKKV